MTADDLTAALRACAAGLYPLEAGVALLIGNGTFLRRDDFTSRFITADTSISDGTTLMAAIDWDAAITALHARRTALLRRGTAYPRAVVQPRRRHPGRPPRRRHRPRRRQHRPARHRHPPRIRETAGEQLILMIIFSSENTSRWGAEHWLRPAAGAPPRSDRSPRGSAGDRATRARAPGQAPRDREPDRPGGGGTASPGAAPDHPGGRERTQETRQPTRPPAATRHQDRQASPDHGRQPGSPRQFGAAAKHGTVSC